MLRFTPALVSIVVIVATVGIVAPTRGDYVASEFAVSIDNPTVKRGNTAVIVARISARDGYRITDSYRHRIVNLSSADGDVELARKVVRGSVSDGAVVFRVEVVPKTAGAHMVVGVFRFSVNNGERLDIKAAPFESTVTATD